MDTTGVLLTPCFCQCNDVHCHLFSEISRPFESPVVIFFQTGLTVMTRSLFDFGAVPNSILYGVIGLEVNYVSLDGRW